MKKPVRWTAEEKAIFTQYAGKLSDEEIAKLTGHTILEVERRRGTYGIKKPDPYKFPKTFRDYVRDNYRTMTNKDMTAALKLQFPNLDITPNSIKTLMTNLGLKREQQDFAFIHDQLMKRGAWNKFVIEGDNSTLKVWYVMAVIKRDQKISLDPSDPSTNAVVNLMQSSLKLKRAIKEYKNATKALGNTTDNKVEGTPTKDD